MQKYVGSCHCKAVKFSFLAPKIDSGVRCNCSICVRKGAVMSAFVLAPDELQIEAADDALSCYEFGQKLAKHYFCKHCGIYPFNGTMRWPGHYRVNLGCVDGVDTFDLKIEKIEGATAF